MDMKMGPRSRMLSDEEREDILFELDERMWSVREMSKRMGITRWQLYNALQRRCGCTAEVKMAITTWMRKQGLWRRK